MAMQLASSYCFNNKLFCHDVSSVKKWMVKVLGGKSMGLRAAPARTETGMGFVHMGMHGRAGSWTVVRADGGKNRFMFGDRRLP